MNCNLARVCTKALTIILGLLTTSWCQTITRIDRDRALDMLQQISTDVKKHYYDPKFHGVNWDAKVEEMKQKIKAADSMNLALAEVATTLDSLNDSHTYFVPPGHALRYDWGWQAQMIGDRCFVLRVRPGSDAEKKGVKAGDELLALNGYMPTRQNFWRIDYVFNTLRPQPSLKLDLRDPSGKERQVDVLTTMSERKRTMDLTSGDDYWDVLRQEENQAHLGRASFVDIGEDVGVLKFPGFYFNIDEIDSMIAKARKHKALILDLRGNPGGSVDALKYLISGCFEKEVKIADRVGRSEQKPMIAKPRSHPFTGKLVVLVDSKSGSAAELFARVVQIEKRGTVIGDRSYGGVMEAMEKSYKSGIDTVVFFWASITEADLIMTDGKSLEHVGVLPDELVLPTAEDLANGRDPVLARAVETAGAKLTPEAAGKLIPYEWPKI